MPLYHLACSKEGCDGPDIEVVIPYKQASELKCTVCESAMKIVPSASAFKINGFNAANGYHRETINYDGSGG